MCGSSPISVHNQETFVMPLEATEGPGVVRTSAPTVLSPNCPTSQGSTGCLLVTSSFWLLHSQ